jgi:hypothetical protein
MHRNSSAISFFLVSGSVCLTDLLESGGIMQRWGVALVVLIVVAAGCGQSETVNVTGTVMLRDKPIENAEVMFNPKGAGRMAAGATDASGKFTLSTAKPNDGAVPGEYVVTLAEYYPPGKAPALPPKGGLLPSRFPPKYGDPNTSPLTVTVERGAKNDFQLDVK